jgi:glycine hydroxymethyltransferase
MNKLLWQSDPELARCVELEENRQESYLEMIASESIQSEESLSLAGGAFNNKTAVGRPGYQRLMGSQYADMLEALAAKRACEVFGADHANMTTYSGSIANYCAYSACLELGDRVVAMESSAGAHQTHGDKRNKSSKLYDFKYFGLNKETMLIDYEEAERVIALHRPKLVVVGSASYSRNIDYEKLGAIAHKNQALLMADIAHFSGLIAAGLSPNPFPHADIVTASTTKTMCGAHSGFIMCKRELAEAVDRSIYPENIASLHLQTIAAMAYALHHSQSEEFKSLMRRVITNAKALCAALEKRGFGILTGGTDCHMFVADCSAFCSDSEKIAQAMQKADISVNTKAIPFDCSPTPRGIRAGTTVLTQRGMGIEEMEYIADLWLTISRAPDEEAVISDVKERVSSLMKRFPAK